MPGAQGGNKGQLTDDDFLPIELAVMGVRLHQGGNVSVTKLIQAIASLDFPLQGQHRQLYRHLIGEQYFAFAGLLIVAEQLGLQ